MEGTPENLLLPSPASCENPSAAQFDGSARDGATVSSAAGWEGPGEEVLAIIRNRVKESVREKERVAYREALAESTARHKEQAQREAVQQREALIHQLEQQRALVEVANKRREEERAEEAASRRREEERAEAILEQLEEAKRRRERAAEEAEEEALRADTVRMEIARVDAAREEVARREAAYRAAVQAEMCRAREGEAVPELPSGNAGTVLDRCSSSQTMRSPAPAAASSCPPPAYPTYAMPPPLR